MLARFHLTVQDELGNLVHGASVTVRREISGLPLVPVYSDRESVSALGNPFVAADGADAGFYVAGGFYRITAEKDGWIRTWSDVAIGTAQGQDFQSAFNPRGAWSAVITYAKSDYVERFGANFVSNADNNLNHAPVTSPVPASNTYWTLTGRPSRYDLSSYDTDRPASGEQVLKWVAPEGGARFYAGLTDSRAQADVAAAAAATYSIRKNDIQFATLTFGSGSDVGVFACASDVSFDDGDVLTIIAPGARDATLGGIAFTLVGFVARP